MLYRVRRRTGLGGIGESELKNEEEIVWANKVSPCRESERMAGLG
jgi:hypothetical protein